MTQPALISNNRKAAFLAWLEQEYLNPKVHVSIANKSTREENGIESPTLPIRSHLASSKQTTTNPGFVAAGHAYARALFGWFRSKPSVPTDTPTSITEILSRPYRNGSRSPFEVLPQEIILEILSHLAPESRVCLATCSRMMAKRLGTRHLLAVRRSRHGPTDTLQCEPADTVRRHLSTRCRYLELLASNKPSLYCCNVCARLHSIHDKDHAAPSREYRNSPSRRTSCYLDLGDMIEYKLALHHAKQAMALHRFKGSSDGRLDTLHHTAYEPFSTKLQTLIFDIEARSSSNHLLIRTQHVLGVTLSSKCSIRQSARNLSLILCWHYDWSQVARAYGRSTRMVQCPTSHNTHDLSATCTACDFEPLCPFCPTELAIEKLLSKTGGLGIVVVTQWKDLGSILTPEDRVWRAHSVPSWHDREDPPYPKEFGWRGWTDPKWGLAAVRQRFDEQQGVSVEALTLANLGRLKGLMRSWRSRFVSWGFIPELN